MSYLATWQLGNSGLALAVIRLQDSVHQDCLLSHWSCASSLDAQPKESISSLLALLVAATILLFE